MNESFIVTLCLALVAGLLAELCASIIWGLAGRLLTCLAVPTIVGVLLGLILPAVGPLQGLVAGALSGICVYSLLLGQFVPMILRTYDKPRATSSTSSAALTSEAAQTNDPSTSAVSPTASDAAPAK